MKRHPGQQDRPGGELVVLRRGLAFVSPHLARFPELEENGQQDQCADPADDIDQRRAHEVRPEELQAAEDQAAGEQSGPDGERLAGAAEDAHEPERQDEGGEGQDAAEHGAEVRLGSPVTATSVRTGLPRPP